MLNNTARRSLRHTLILAALWLWATGCQGQNAYPFIHKEANVLHYDSSSSTLRYFFNKWNRVAATGQGTVNIIHIGGSHVQAGVFPNQVRTHHAAIPQPGRGSGHDIPLFGGSQVQQPRRL